MIFEAELENTRQQHFFRRMEENSWLSMSREATEALSQIDALVAVSLAATEADQMTPELGARLQLTAAEIRATEPWAEVSAKSYELYLKSNISKQNGAQA